MLKMCNVFGQISTFVIVRKTLLLRKKRIKIQHIGSEMHWALCQTFYLISLYDLIAPLSLISPELFVLLFLSSAQQGENNFHYFLWYLPITLGGWPWNQALDETGSGSSPGLPFLASFFRGRESGRSCLIQVLSWSSSLKKKKKGSAPLPC